MMPSVRGARLESLKVFKQVHRRSVTCKGVISVEGGGEEIPWKIVYMIQRAQGTGGAEEGRQVKAQAGSTFRPSEPLWAR